MLFVPHLGGPVLIDPAIAHISAVATLPASGELVIPFAIPVLPFVSIPQFVQAVYVAPNGKLNFGSGSVLLLLDQSF